jgi:hypothetical protein
MPLQFGPGYTVPDSEGDTIEDRNDEETDEDSSDEAASAPKRRRTLARRFASPFALDQPGLTSTGLFHTVSSHLWYLSEKLLIYFEQPSAVILPPRDVGNIHERLSNLEDAHKEESVRVEEVVAQVKEVVAQVKEVLAQLTKSNV